MLFMARINDYIHSLVTTDYSEDGTAITVRPFFTIAVAQFHPNVKEEKKACEINGKTKKKTVFEFNSASRIHGHCNAYFDIDVPNTILEDIAIAVQAGYIPKTTIINLCTDNWDNIKTEYADKTGLFAYRNRLENIIK